MKRKVYSKALVFGALLGIGIAGLASVANLKDHKNVISAKAEEAQFFDWKGKFAGGWNPNPDALPQGYCSYIVALKDSGFPKVNGGNLKNEVGSGDHVTLNGTPIMELDGVDFNHSQNNQYVLLKFPKSLIVNAEGKDYCELHIQEGTLFDGYKLRELTIHINTSTYVGTIVTNKKVATNVTGIDPYCYSKGWFRIDLEGYPFVKKDNTLTYYNYLNFANKIYVNGNPNTLLLTPNQENYSITYNVSECNGLSFNGSKLAVAVDDIQSLTIPAGTEFPSVTDSAGSDYQTAYVTQKDQTFVRYGNSFFEEVPTNVTNYFPRVWGANQRAFQLEGFTDASGSGGEKNNHAFNFNSKIYINKDPNNCLFESPTRASAYFEMGHKNSFGVVLAKDYDANPERYVTIPAGTQFPDSKAWKGQIGGKVFVTKDEVTFGRTGTTIFQKTTEIKESVNYGLTSLEGFKGSTADLPCLGTNATNFPINNYNPFQDGNFHFKFYLNNAGDNNFTTVFLMNAVLSGQGVSGGYEFKFAKGYGSIAYDGKDITPITYFNFENFIPDYDYEMELFFIKVDPTHVRLGILMNGFCIADTLRDCSNDILGNLCQAKVFTTTDSGLTLKNIDVDAEALDIYCNNILKMGEEATTVDYANAKSYLLNNLTPTQRTKFYTNSQYASALARLEALAVENSEHAVLTANFTGINQYNNNIDIIDQAGMKRSYLEFDAKPVNGFNGENFAGNAASINGVNCSSIENFKMWCIDPNGNFVIIDYPASAIKPTEEYPYTYFHVNAGVKTPETYPWTTLGEVNMYLDANGKWNKVSGIHTVKLIEGSNVKTMYIPDGLTVPGKDLSKYCSYSYKIDGVEFDLSTPVTSNLTITLETTEHQYVHHDAIASTCVKHGEIEHWTCENCDKLFVEESGEKVEVSSIEAELVAHTIVPVEGKASTCVEHGWKDYFKCSVCGALFEDAEGKTVISDFDVWKAGAGRLDLVEHTVDPEKVHFDFEADGSLVVVTYECSVCHQTITVPANEVSLTSAITKNATCEEKGQTTYTATWLTYSDTLVLDNIPSIGHDWGTPTYVWNGDECTATRVCANDKDHVETETVKGVYVKDTDATCEGDEKGHYEATFKNAAFAKQVTAKDSVVKENTAIGHDWNTPTYSWSGDECTATRVCKHDSNHVETETVKGVYVKDTDATCEGNEKGHYEATFENAAFAKQVTAKDSVVKENTATGHDWNAATYVWNGDECTATRVCKNDPSHVETETAKGIYVKDTDVTCEGDEKGHYEATFENAAFAKQVTAKDSVVKENTATGHHYGDVEYSFNEETHVAIATITCVDGDSTVREEVEAVYVKDTDATTEANEKGHWEATFVDERFGSYITEANSYEVPNSKLPEPAKKGCGGSVIAASAVVTGLALAGVALVANKKKED